MLLTSCHYTLHQSLIFDALILHPSLVWFYEYVVCDDNICNGFVAKALYNIIL